MPNFTTQNKRMEKGTAKTEMFTWKVDTSNPDLPYGNADVGSKKNALEPNQVMLCSTELSQYHTVNHN